MAAEMSAGAARATSKSSRPMCTEITLLDGKTFDYDPEQKVKV